jgi:thiosulfate dehydrogenase
MRGFPGIDPTSDDARALFDYLGSLPSSDDLAALPLTIVEDVVDPGRGDAARGGVAYDRACRVCHGDPHTGDGRLGPDVVVIPEASQALGKQLGVDARLVVTEKIRHGQFFGVGGNMPFYPREVLSDAELADLLEYLDP